MKKQNINIRNLSGHIDEKEKNIMRRKIEFLEIQIAQSSKRQAALRKTNDDLRDCLAQVSNDKQNVLDLINGDSQLVCVQSQLCELQKQHDQLKKDYSEQQSKLDQIGHMLGQRYRQEICRVEQHYQQLIKELESKHQQEKEFHERKLKNFQKTIDKYSRLCQQVAPSRDSTYQRKISQRQSINGNVSLQSFCLPIDTNLSFQNSFMGNHQAPTPTLGQQSMKYSQGFPVEKTECSMLSESDLEPIHPQRHDDRQPINRSKSIFLLDTSYNSVGHKGKTIVTSLYCRNCHKDYAPNEYYRHLKKCQDSMVASSIEPLLLKKQSIQKQISAIKGRKTIRRQPSPEQDFESENQAVADVVVLVKQRQKQKKFHSSSRGSETSRPKIRC